MSALLKELRYSLYLIVHPFKGFWEIKHERKGSLRTAVLWLILYVLTTVLSGFCTAYLFNPGGGVNFNVYQSVATTLCLFFLWCIASWCLTSLYDGEGKFIDIVKATAYALIPLDVYKRQTISHRISVQTKLFAGYSMCQELIY